MPTYAYTCTVCGHAFDVHQSFDDAPLTVCPECSGALRKVFSPVGVVFKGSGFYRTDARSSAKGTTGSTKEPAAASSSSSSSDKGGSSSSAPASSGSSSSTSSSGSSSSAKAAAG